MKIKFLTAAMILGLAYVVIVDTTTAQKRAQRRAAKPIVPTATPTPTPVPTPIPTPTPEPEASLQFDAGLIFKSGDVKPVARTTFYLFDGHLGEILRDGGVKSTMGGAQADPTSPQLLLLQFALCKRTEVLPDSAAFVKLAMPVLQPHIVQTVTTDFNGKAQFPPVKPGTYYLTGFAEVGKASATWNLKITLKSGSNSVTLDNENAEELYNRSY